MKIKMLLAVFALLFSSVSMAAVDCLPVMDYGDATGMKQATIESAYQKKEDPKADLEGCFMDANIRGVAKARAECPCNKAVKKLCKFDKKKRLKWHDPDVPAIWCVMFKK